MAATTRELRPGAALKDPDTKTIAEMRAIVREAAEPRPPVDSIKAALGRASAALGLTYRRTTSLWYGYDTVRVRPEEAARLHAEADRLRLLRIERLEREIAELRAEVRRQDAQAAAARRVPLAHGKVARLDEAAPLTGCCCQ